MPKTPKSSEEKIKTILSEFGTEFTKTSLNKLFCKICNTIVSCERISSVLIHRKTASHNRNLTISGKRNQTFIVKNKDSLIKNIVTAFLSADIPLYKLRNMRIKNLFNILGHSPPFRI